MIGLVIPLFLTKFIDDAIKNLQETTKGLDLKVCFVNDGKPEVKAHFDKITLPENMYVIHREKTGCFATANNTGFKSLVEKYPNIEYLGTINDDTIPAENWLHALIESLEKAEDIAAAAPNVREFPNGVEEDAYATFNFSNEEDVPMVVKDKKVYEDTITNSISGCCFIAKAKYLKYVDFFDPVYLNGCEDVDLALKFKEDGLKIVASAKSKIAHLGGSSRKAKRDIFDNVTYSLKALSLKWGTDLEKYND